MVLIIRAVLSVLPVLARRVQAEESSANIPGVKSFVVPSSFPTSIFSSYYFSPVATAEPQPVLYDPILNITYPRNLTDPKTIPTADDDPVYYPKSIANITNATAEAFIQIAIGEVISIIENTDGGLMSNCSKCVAALSVGKLAAQVAPQLLPEALEFLCRTTGFGTNSSCKTTYDAGSYGAVWTQVLFYADITGTDGRYICNSLSATFCPAPALTPLNMTGLFPKPKPKNPKKPKRNGKVVKVLHMSDFHLDSRYSLASEANCTSR
jgi:hypothetical protein